MIKDTLKAFQLIQSQESISNHIPLELPVVGDNLLTRHRLTSPPSISNV
jgi:hypothetical protein